LKILRKVAFYFGLTLAVVVASLFISVFLFKDEILNRFIEQANRHLNTPVKIGRMDVSLFHSFPQLSIVCTDVYIEDSHSGQYPLLTAKQISFQLNPLEAYQGVYHIHGLEVVNSETHLKINARGEVNYAITKVVTDSLFGSGSLRFNLSNIALVQCRVHYLDLQHADDFIFFGQELKANIESENDVYTIAAHGQVTTEKIATGSLSLLQNKNFSITTRLIYNDEERNLMIQPSEVTLKKSVFHVQGSYRWKQKNTIQLTGSGKNTDIQTLLSLLPEESAAPLQQYRSKGEVYFNLRMQGEISKTANPSLSIDFGFTDATFTHPEFSSTVEHASLEGSFATASIKDLSNATLSLKNISGQLNSKSFTASLVMQHLSDPDVIFSFQGELDAASVLGFYPVPGIHEVSGTVVADVSFEGKPAWLKSKATAQQAATLGTVEIHNLHLSYGKKDITLANLNGVLQFNNNDIAMSNLGGQLNSSDFLLNGFFKNGVTFLLFDNQPLGIEADLTSQSLYLDEVFDLAFRLDSANTTSTNLTFGISENLHLKFNCDVDYLRYKKFSARNIKGDLRVTGQKAISKQITFNALGGAMLFTGIVDAQNPRVIGLSSAFRLSDISLDSIFFVFDNFRQDFIRDSHLKGLVQADVTVDVSLKPDLSIFPETLVADIEAVIKNGELNNFEPLYALNKYLDDEGLKALRFGELKNDIHIENKTVFIPQMEVLSNVTALQISGKHTFNQEIDYRIVTPLNTKRKIDLTEAEGAVEEMEGKAKVYLKVTGTTDDYRVQYDTEAVRKKIANDFKKEVQELRDLLKNKKKKKEVELSNEEFEWENVP
jgi:hypothetical protein